MLKFIFILLVISTNVQAYWSCAWPYRTQVNVNEVMGTELNNYQIKIELSAGVLNSDYQWTENGFDIRILDYDDSTLLDFWIESWNKINKTATIWVKLNELKANQNRILYFYYGNDFADKLANIPFTFVEPGIKFHTRESTQNPSNLSQAFDAFDASNDNNANYGCTFITNFSKINNRGTFGSNSNFIAYSETYFKVKASDEGLWSIRYGADFGRGGGLYVDGIPLEEDWNNDLWWSNDWNNVDVLQGSINLKEGYHKLEVIGAEGCCDGGITVQFQKPNANWVTYSTANIEVRSRACPVVEPTIKFGDQSTSSCSPPIATYRLDEGGWSQPEDVIDEFGIFSGSMIGSISNVTSAKVCGGFEVGDNRSASIIDSFKSGVQIVDDVGAQGSVSFWLNLNDDWNDGRQRKILDASFLPNNSVREKYFYLDKQADGSLYFAFEDSADFDIIVVEPGSSSRIKDTWYLLTITFDFINGEFKLYEGETLIASTSRTTSGTIRDLNFIHFGDKIMASSKGGSGSSTNGIFDEINIFNTIISVSEIRGLLAKFRSCQIMTKSCESTFPDGLSSIGDRTVYFGFNSILRNNPDTQLSAFTIASNAGSTLLTCETENCSKGDDAVIEVSPGVFKTTTATNDVTLNVSSTGDIGTLTNEFDSVSLGYRSNLTINASRYSDFYIDDLNLAAESTLNLSSGTYWIRDISVNYKAKINIVDGPAHIYIGENVSWSSETEINSPAKASSGDPSNLFMYFYPNFSFGSDTTFSGVIYAAKTFILNSSNIFGLVTANRVNLGAFTKFNYDERGYDALTSISWCDGKQSTLDRISIVSPTTAVNCESIPITITMLDSVGSRLDNFEGRIVFNTSTGHGDWRTDSSASGILENQVANDGSGYYDMVSADKGTVTLFLKNSFPELTDITFESQGVLASTGIQFSEAGFIFSTISDQIASKKSNNILLSAVQTDQATGACQALLIDEQDINMALECIAPDQCGVGNNMINDSYIPTNSLSDIQSFKKISLNFGNQNDEASVFNTNYSDAGKNRIWAKYEILDAAGGSTGNFISGSSNEFVTTPAGFCIESSDPNWQCSVPGLSSACDPFQKAGSPFNLLVTAKQANGSSTDFCSHQTTSNFNSNIKLSHNLVSPKLIDGGHVGMFSLDEITLSSGVGSSEAEFDEMGVFTINAGGNSYYSSSLPITTSENFGRFFPSHFKFVSSTPAFYADGNTGFTYIGQVQPDNITGSIFYATQPEFIFQIEGADNQKLKNFISPFYSEPSASVTATSSILGALDPAQVLTISAVFSNGAVTGPNTNDEFTYKFNALDHFKYDRTANSIRSPFNNDIKLNINSFSEPVDNVSLSSSPVITGVGGLVYFGRIRIENAFGPETSQQQQLWMTEYFDGNSYKLNTLDNGTGFDFSNVNNVVVKDQGNSNNPLQTTDSSISLDTGKFLSGYATAVWSATVGQRYGSFSFIYDVQPWLTFDWSNAGFEHPSGAITFGYFRGNDKIIYWKEINY